MIKAIYLMLLITDVNGNESLQRVNDTAYKSMIECKVDQMHHRNDQQFTFYCVDSKNVAKR